MHQDMVQDILKNYDWAFIPTRDCFSIFLAIRFPTEFRNDWFVSTNKSLMTAAWLELEQPVELIENIFVDVYPTHWRPSTLMRRANIRNYWQG